MKELQKEIKNQAWQNVYLLYGEEDYLRLQYKDNMTKALNPDGDTMNFTVFSGKDINPAEIIDLGETMPFFAERRVILVTDSGFFKNKCEKLPEYIAQLPDYLVLIFVETEVDKRSRMYKAVAKNGRVTEFKRQTEATLKNWTFRKIKAEGKNIREEDLQLFLSRTGADMCRISTELEKLLSYCADEAVITREAILTITSEEIENQIFVMVKAITEKRQKKALDLYDDLLALKEPPLRILFLIARQFNILMQVREMSQSHMSQNEIAEKIGVRSFVVREALSVTGRYKAGQLRKAVEEITRMEEDVKSGRISDKLSVELIIVKFSS